MKKICTLLLLSVSALSLYAAVHTVQVSDFTFTPANVNALCGDTVLWNWAPGAMPHTTTSTAVPACANGWNAPINSTSTSFMYIVPCAGNYLYVCTLHPGMNGSITAACLTPVNEVSQTFTGAFPNPFTNRLTVYPGGNDFIRVSDILGKEIRSLAIPHGTESLIVELSVARGIYFLRFYSEGILTETRKLIRN